MCGSRGTSEVSYCQTPKPFHDAGLLLYVSGFLSPEKDNITPSVWVLPSLASEEVVRTEQEAGVGKRAAFHFSLSLFKRVYVVEAKACCHGYINTGKYSRVEDGGWGRWP